jgi:hypothetical protein
MMGSEYSQASRRSSAAQDQKLISKSKKKKGQKKMKQVEGLNDMSESLGASENDGLHKATAARESQLEQAQKMKADLRSKADLANNQMSIISPSGSEIKKVMSKADMQKQNDDATALIKGLEEDERLRAKAEYERQSGGSGKMTNVIMPQYTLDTRLNVDKEKNAPPKEMYIGLGWDENKETKRRHYRKYYATELEDVTAIFPTPSPFNSYNLTKGQSRGTSEGMFSSKKTDDSGQASTEQEVGIFKGIIEVENPQAKKIYQIERDAILDEMKGLLNELSKKQLNKDFVIDTGKLADPAVRD